jgi:hypothetical protein
MAIPIPAVDKWELNFVTLGAKWGNWLDKNQLAFGVESQVWYYDGGRVYLELAELTNDQWPGVKAPPAQPPSYYAASILNQYEDYILAQANPNPGYRIFPYGMLMAYRKTGEQKHADTIMHLAKHSAFIAVNMRYLREHGEPKGACWSPWSIRESAYNTDVMIAYQLLTGAEHQLLNVGVYDCVIADFDEFMDPAGTTFNGATGTNPCNSHSCINNFMLGLALETLINYYEMSALYANPDASIIPYVGKALDFIWANSLEKGTAAMYYNSDPVNGLNATKDTVYTASSLNNLVSPAFAWYYDKTHEAVYQERGDAMFAAGVNGAGTNCQASKTSQDYSYTGKQFSQNYKWSPDYVKWRQTPYGTVTSPADVPPVAYEVETEYAEGQQELAIPPANEGEQEHSEHNGSESGS